MITTPQMALKVWNLAADPYNSGQLADNLARIDEHDHSGPPKGKQISTASIADGSVTSAKFAPGAIPPPPTQQPIGTSLLVDGSVTGPKLAAGAVTLGSLPTHPQVKVTRLSSAPVAPGVTGALVSFTDSIFDTDGMSSVGVSPTQITCHTPGAYIINANYQLTFVSSYYGNASCSLLVNGTVASYSAAYTQSYNSIDTGLDTGILVRLNNNDYIQLRTFSDRGHSVSNASMSAIWVSS